MDLPKSMEGYYQETGRAGRDGLPADAWMAYGLGDVILLRQMVDGSDANEQRKHLERQKLDALLGFCETTQCRRAALLHYFGERYNAPCGNCDNCLEPVETWDGSVVAQMALSCAYRTGQRFGVGHLIDVLLGKSTAQIERFGHHKISTFGIGLAYKQTQWSSIYRQLVAAGMLNVDMEGHGGLRLTDASRPLLKGEQAIAFRQDPPPRKRLAKPSSVSRDNAMVGPGAEGLWQALKEKRLQLAREQGVPPYIIFHDSTLLEMLDKRPRRLTELAQITGVGARKLERYGAAFMDVLTTHY